VRVDAPGGSTASPELEYPEGGQREADAHGGKVTGVSDR
jgi:hypothetical protein